MTAKTAILASAVLWAFAAPAALGADCLPAEKLGPPGNYSGGVVPFPSGIMLMARMVPVTQLDGSLYMGTPQLVPVPNECTLNALKSAMALATNASDLEFMLSQLVKRVTIEYCDGASLNNLSARPMAYDFVGPLEKADGTQLPSTNGPGGLANVAVRETHAAMREGTVELSDGVQFVQFGGHETLITSICIE